MFFFSSRRRHTRWPRDWSSDVCSSDLPIVFQTLDEENRNIVLVDGTNISMNSNSRIVIASDYLKGKREITLVGEAYFDVARNPDQPFVIHAKIGRASCRERV